MQTDDLFITDADFARVMALRPDQQLRRELERAIIVSQDAISSSVVTMYSRVCYRDEYDSVYRQIQIVYPEDADVEQGKFSVLEPAGAALLGLALGQAIDWEFPDGQPRRLRVEEILYQPETWPREVLELGQPSY